MTTKRDRMYQQIQRHGENLNAIFHTDLDPVVLCKKLHRLEARASRAATDYCNGDIDANAMDAAEDNIMAALDKILHYTSAPGIPVFFNRDPRGYALKISSGFASTVKIYRDWGGYGIICPEFNGN